MDEKDIGKDIFLEFIKKLISVKDTLSFHLKDLTKESQKKDEDNVLKEFQKREENFYKNNDILNDLDVIITNLKKIYLLEKESRKKDIEDFNEFVLNKMHFLQQNDSNNYSKIKGID